MLNYDMFLKIDGVEGESQDTKHPAELEITVFGDRVDNSLEDVGAGRSQLRGLSTWHDATFSMKINRAYPKLWMACNTGELLPKAVLTVRKAGKEQQEFMKITFSDVLVSKCEFTTSTDEVPVVNFSFNFARIEEEYRMQMADGNLTGPMKYSYSIPTASKGEA